MDGVNSALFDFKIVTNKCRRIQTPYQWFKSSLLIDGFVDCVSLVISLDFFQD